MSEEQTQEERLEKVKLIVKSFEGGVKPHTRRLELRDTDPDYDYRLVRNRTEYVDYRQNMGYELVKEGEIGSSSMEQVDKRLIIAGTYVVMKRDKLIGEAHRQYLKEKSAKMAGSPREAFKAKAQRLGVEVDDKSKSQRAPLSVIMGENLDSEDEA